MKRYATAVVGVFFSMMVLGGLLHGVLLTPIYQREAASLLRTQADMMAHFHWIVLANLLFAAVFVWVYSHGIEVKPAVGQGARLGAAIWVVASLAPNLIAYTIEPWPRSIVLISSAGDLVMMVISGVVGAVLYRSNFQAQRV